MSDSFVVREATPTDYECVCELLARVDDLHRQHIPWLFRTPPGEPRSREFFAQLLSGVGSVVLVAEAEQLIGVATVLMRSSPDFAVFVPQTWGLLDNIAVAQGWRRRGVGTALTRAAERWASERGAKAIELGVYQFNHDAQRFYQALGYSPLSTKLRKPLTDAS